MKYRLIYFDGDYENVGNGLLESPLKEGLLDYEVRNLSTKNQLPGTTEHIIVDGFVVVIDLENFENSLLVA